MNISWPAKVHVHRALLSACLLLQGLHAAEMLHGFCFFDDTGPLPRAAAAAAALAEAHQDAGTYDPNAPCPGLPGSAEHLVAAGVYPSLDCLLQGDRFEYRPSDRNAQFLLLLPAASRQPDGGLRLALNTEQDELTTMTIAAPFNKVSFLLSLADLRPGAYRLTACFVAADGTEIAPKAEYRFSVSTATGAEIELPAEGIPLRLEALAVAADLRWPLRFGVPLPVNAVDHADELGVFAAGARIPAEIRPRATWGPGGSLKWVHVAFLADYRAGQPRDYVLRRVAPTVPAPATGLHCEVDDARIVVDNGTIRFEVDREHFTGLDKVWYDKSGKGQYSDENLVVRGKGGPYLVDGRMIRFTAAADAAAEVVIEEQGPVRVTIAATGWYVSDEDRVPPICQFQTRISAFAGQPFIQVAQHTILAYDTREQRLKDVGFTLPLAAAPESVTVGIDGAPQRTELAAGAEVWLHQDRSDHCRLSGGAKQLIEGNRADGWLSAALPPVGAQVSVTLRDIWQKFPKELGVDGRGVTVHFWPAHGHRAFQLDEELALANIYKFWCFHQGAMLDLNLPNDYFGKFSTDYRSGTFECRPEHALNGNGQGLVIGNEFTIRFDAAAAAAADGDELAAEPAATTTADQALFAAVVQQDPGALAAPEWNAATGALGKMAAADRDHFGAMEDAVELGYLSHTRCIERGNEYGMWNYADTHTYWNVRDHHAELHRVWHNSHYHEMGMSWLMTYRSGSFDLLRWAKASTDHFMNVDTINWADVDHPLKFHTPGAMYHCKGLTHWGGEAFGMTRRDGHAGIAGHWVDPDAMLWDWYLTGNPRAWDVYRLWARSYARQPWYAGTRREANTTLACMINYYLASWDADMLPAIRGMGLSLRTHEPLEQQNPGPMWHPCWINRYYDLTRDPEYVPFILKYARGTHLKDTWLTALAALAYELSGDPSYLTQHARQVHEFPRLFYRAPGDLYDWYGPGPGPLGSRWGGYFGWGFFLAGLHDAGLTGLPPITGVGGNFPVMPSRFDYSPTPPSIEVLALEPEDRDFVLNIQAGSMGGDMHPTELLLFSPSGKRLYRREMPKQEAPKATVPIAADGETGINRIEVRCHEVALCSPLTDLPHEAVVLPKTTEAGRLARTGRVLAWLQPSQPGVKIALQLAADATKGIHYACNFTLRDVTGQLIADGSLLTSRPAAARTLQLDPAGAPWQLDLIGPGKIGWQGDCAMLLLGADAASLKEVLAAQAE